jgi:hypothetical protein
MPWEDSDVRKRDPDTTGLLDMIRCYLTGLGLDDKYVGHCRANFRERFKDLPVSQAMYKIFYDVELPRMVNMKSCLQ